MDNSTEKPKGLYKKLHTIQSKINGLKDDAKAYGYNYVTGHKVLSHVKPLMNDLGLLLKQEVTSIENDRQDYTTSKGAKSEILSKVMMRFTWIDVETGEKDENSFGANGQNDWEKGLGSALTYAERYFLLKFFHIATDEDDVDCADRKKTAPVKPQNNAPANGQQNQNTEKPWLNKMEQNGKDMTSQWQKTIQKIVAKEVTDINVIKQHFRISTDNETELLTLINKSNGNK